MFRILCVSETHKKPNNPLLFWKTLKLIMFFPQEKFLYKFVLEFMYCKFLIKALVYLFFLSTATEYTHPTDKMSVLVFGTAEIFVRSKLGFGSFQSFNHCGRVTVSFMQFSVRSQCFCSVLVCGTCACSCTQRHRKAWTKQVSLQFFVSHLF